MPLQRVVDLGTQQLLGLADAIAETGRLGRADGGVELRSGVVA
jgi:hypothetical protein